MKNKRRTGLEVDHLGEVPDVTQGEEIAGSWYSLLKIVSRSQKPSNFVACRIHFDKNLFYSVLFNAATK